MFSWREKNLSWNLPDFTRGKRKFRNKPHQRNAKKTGWLQKCFIHIPTWGRWTHFDSYFSDGLKPPTRKAHNKKNLVIWLGVSDFSFLFPRVDKPVLFATWKASRKILCIFARTLGKWFPLFFKKSSSNGVAQLQLASHFWCSMSPNNFILLHMILGK